MSVNLPKISSTTEYSQFSFDPTNRPIKRQHVDELKAAIAAKNLLATYPIIVTPEGIVLDGQHRLVAAQELNVPIYYLITTEMTIDDVADANANVESWASVTYLHRYCMLGIEDYQFVKQLHEEYPEVPLTSIRNIASHGDRKGAARRWSTGQYRAIRREFAIRVLRSARDFSPYLKAWKGDTFIASVASLLDTLGYSHERMMRKVQRQSQRVFAQVTVDDYLKMLTAIYNFGEPESRRVVFKNRAFTKQRNFEESDSLRIVRTERAA